MKITFGRHSSRGFGWFSLLVLVLFVAIRLSWDVLHRKPDKPPTNVSLQEAVRIQEEQARQATEAADAYSRKQLP
jgi:hypothetical protein